MTKSTYGWVFMIGFIGMLSLMLLSEPAMAFGFESKMQNLTGQLINTVLPLMSILGLVYAAILALSGDAAAKAKIITVIAVSVVGFLAPAIIQWLQRATGN
ncbi:MAG: TrbC/VirB2 family protein [Bacteriovoracia bacterium]